MAVALAMIVRGLCGLMAAAVVLLVAGAARAQGTTSPTVTTPEDVDAWVRLCRSAWVLARDREWQHAVAAGLVVAIGAARWAAKNTSVVQSALSRVAPGLWKRVGAVYLRWDFVLLRLQPIALSMAALYIAADAAGKPAAAALWAGARLGIEAAGGHDIAVGAWKEWQRRRRAT